MPAWKPDDKLFTKIDEVIKEHRVDVEKNLAPLVLSYYPSLMTRKDNEYGKMVELSAKMTLVGHACTNIAGLPFDKRRRMISSLFGACCFLGDSFIDDFGEKAAEEYIERFELLLTKGWFEIRNEREQLFYVILSRLFAERDVLDTMLRQAIFGQFLAQKRDVCIRINPSSLTSLPRRQQLKELKECARDRGGYVTMVLSLLLVPEIPLRYHHLLFLAGALFMYIDDHGDSHYDRHDGRITYMNQLRSPQGELQKIFDKNISLLREELPICFGSDALLAFLFRYFITRLKKHNLERHRGRHAWTHL